VDGESIPPALQDAITDADRILARKKAELQDLEEKVLQNKQKLRASQTHIVVDAPIPKDETYDQFDKALGRGVRQWVMKYLAIPLAGVVGAATITVVNRVVSPPATADKVQEIKQQADANKSVADTIETRLSACEKRWEAQKVIDESTQDWLALLLSKQNITPRSSSQEYRIPNTITLNSAEIYPQPQPKKLPKYVSTVELPPIPARW